MKIKYVAGLVDSDGSITFKTHKSSNGLYNTYPEIEIAQLAVRCQILKELADEWAVEIKKKKVKNHEREAVVFKMSGNKARRFLEQIKQHLVLKQDIVEYVLNESGLGYTKEQLKVLKDNLRVLRKEEQVKKKSKLSYQWAAGYVDGDGCLSAILNKHGSVNVTLDVTSWVYKEEGLVLLQRNFGGTLKNQGSTLHWRLPINQYNAVTVLGKLAKHSWIKRQQLEYVKNFMSSGKHFKARGATRESNQEFCNNLKDLKRVATTEYEAGLIS
jgi:hypothetical protein